MAQKEIGGELSEKDMENIEKELEGIDEEVKEITPQSPILATEEQLVEIVGLENALKISDGKVETHISKKWEVKKIEQLTEEQAGEFIRHLKAIKEKRMREIEKRVKPEHERNTVQEDKELTPEQVNLVKKMVAPGASDDELQLFLYTCKKLNLDPLRNQIYFIRRNCKNEETGEWGKVGTIQVGVDGLRTLAARTGKLRGIKRQVIVDAEGNITGATAKVWREGWSEPAEVEVDFEEYCQKT